MWCILCSRWYHGHISREDAEKILMDSGNVNAFLVRESHTKPGDYVISVRNENSEIINVLVSFEVSWDKILNNKDYLCKYCSTFIICKSVLWIFQVDLWMAVWTQWLWWNVCKCLIFASEWNLRSTRQWWTPSIWHNYRSCLSLLWEDADNCWSKNLTTYQGVILYWHCLSTHCLHQFKFSTWPICSAMLNVTLSVHISSLSATCGVWYIRIKPYYL